MAFREADWEVIATARDRDDITDLKDVGCQIAALDVTNDDQIKSVRDTHLADGDLTCLVNNAGYAQLGPLEDLSIASVKEQFDVNVFGPHRLIRATLPALRAGDRGRIINLSSVTGRLSLPGIGAYSGSKFALEAMSDALRGEVDSFGIDVVLVEPGPVETSFTTRANSSLDDGTEPSGLYESIYELIEDTQLILDGGPLTMTPERVADEILDAGTRANPPARIPIGPIARFVIATRFLPDRWRDFGIRLIRRLG